MQVLNQAYFHTRTFLRAVHSAQVLSLSLLGPCPGDHGVASVRSPSMVISSRNRGDASVAMRILVMVTCGSIHSSRSGSSLLSCSGFCAAALASCARFLRLIRSCCLWTLSNTADWLVRACASAVVVGLEAPLRPSGSWLLRYQCEKSMAVRGPVEPS